MGGAIVFKVEIEIEIERGENNTEKDRERARVQVRERDKKERQERASVNENLWPACVMLPRRHEQIHENGLYVLIAYRSPLISTSHCLLGL